MYQITKSISTLKLEDLLTKLSDLEATLHEFSYESLTAAEAQELKDTLERFRTLLQDRMKQQSQENSEKEFKSVFNMDEETNKSESDSEISTAHGELAEHSSFGSTRFTAYLKESELSNRQLSYINAILAAAEIDTRITNDPITPLPAKDVEKNEDGSRPENFKTKAMSSTNKKASKTGHSSKLGNSVPSKLDLNPILEDCLGKKDLLKELINLFKRNALEFIGQLKIHLENHDFEAVRFASHKMKSGLRMMNTRELLVIAEQIELESRKKQDIKHLKFLFNCFVTEYPEVERAIDKAFEELN